MDELSEDDKLTVARARKIQRFLSQPFQVAEVFTGKEGKLVPLEDTIKGFQRIVAGASVHSFGLISVGVCSDDHIFVVRLESLTHLMRQPLAV